MFFKKKIWKKKNTALPGPSAEKTKIKFLSIDLLVTVEPVWKIDLKVVFSARESLTFTNFKNRIFKKFWSLSPSPYPDPFELRAR